MFSEHDMNQTTAYSDYQNPRQSRTAPEPRALENVRPNCCCSLYHNFYSEFLHLTLHVFENELHNIRILVIIIQIYSKHWNRWESYLISIQPGYFCHFIWAGKEGSAVKRRICECFVLFVFSVGVGWGGVGGWVGSWMGACVEKFIVPFLELRSWIGYLLAITRLSVYISRWC